MKYHYRSPEEVREKFGKSSEKLKNPMFNRTFFLLVADVVIILIAGSLLYKSGYADLMKSGEGVIKIHYERTDPGHIRLHLTSDLRDILLVDGQTSVEKDKEKNTAVLHEIRWELDRGDQILILRDPPRFQPVYIEAKKGATLDLTVPESARAGNTPKFELLFQNRQVYPDPLPLKQP